MVVLAALTVAACSSTETGQATATSTAGSGSSGVSLPPRPQDISLSGVDACALLTGAQQSQFQVHAGVKAPQATGFTGSACTFQFASEAAGQLYGISADTSPGIEHWLNPYLTDNVTQVTIAGFPAVTVSPKNAQATGCTTAVSVANGQMLEASTALIATGMTKVQSCEKTNAVAEAAMATLQTLK